jgi:hypothetical protein
MKCWTELKGLLREMVDGKHSRDMKNENENRCMKIDFSDVALDHLHQCPDLAG